MRSPLGLFSVSRIRSPFGHHLLTSLLTSAHICSPAAPAMLSPLPSCPLLLPSASSCTGKAPVSVPVLHVAKFRTPSPIVTLPDRISDSPFRALMKGRIPKMSGVPLVVNWISPFYSTVVLRIGLSG
jgi:hypothetical protein